MALIKCSECGSEVSDKAQACPKCGAPIGARAADPGPIARPGKWARMSLSSKIGVILAVLVLVVFVRAVIAFLPDGSSPVAASGPASRGDDQACNVKKFEVTGHRINDSGFLVGTVVNHNTVACGVALNVSTFDKAGTLVDTNGGISWPASVNNIEPETPFNFTLNMVGRQGAATYSVTPSSAKVWARSP